MMKKEPGKLSFSEMSADKLYIYMVDVMHPYLKKALATFSLCSKMIVNAHKSEEGSIVMGNLFVNLVTLIEQHLQEDEQTLFPYIRSKMGNADQNRKELSMALEKIRSEHEAIADLFKDLRTISNNYTPSVDSSSGIKLCYAQLFNFEQDVLRHIFLEEDVLFPKLLMINN